MREISKKQKKKTIRFLENNWNFYWRSDKSGGGGGGATDLDVGLKLVVGSGAEDDVGADDRRGRRRRRRRARRLSGAEQQAVGLIIARRHRTLGTDVGRPAIVARTPFPVRLGGRPVAHGRDAVRERVRQLLPSVRRCRRRRWRRQTSDARQRPTPVRHRTDMAREPPPGHRRARPEHCFGPATSGIHMAVLGFAGAQGRPELRGPFSEQKKSQIKAYFVRWLDQVIKRYDEFFTVADPGSVMGVITPPSIKHQGWFLYVVYTYYYITST